LWNSSFGRFILFITACAQLGVLEAQSAQPEALAGRSWTEGLHLFVAAGANTTLFNSNIEGNEVGGGASVRSDISYVINQDLAIDLSTSVNFNRVDGLLIWDNIFGLGARSRVPAFDLNDGSLAYTRFFMGRGPLIVVFERNKPAEYELIGAQRLQLEGPVYGLGFGYTQATSKDETWFLEVLITVHWLNRLEVIKSDREVPEIVSKRLADEESLFSGLHVIVGIMAF